MTTSTRETLMLLVLDAMRDVLAARGINPTTLDENSPLLGPGAIVDSIGLVNVILEVEQRLADQGHAVSLTSEKAMSLTRSPFRSPASLVQHVLDSLNAENSPRG